jgi:hypothetical protein
MLTIKIWDQGWNIPVVQDLFSSPPPFMPVFVDFLMDIGLVPLRRFCCVARAFL